MLYMLVALIIVLIGGLILVGYNLPSQVTSKKHAKLATLIAIGAIVLFAGLFIVLNQITGGSVNLTGMIGELFIRSVNI